MTQLTLQALEKSRTELCRYGEITGGKRWTCCHQPRGDACSRIRASRRKSDRVATRATKEKPEVIRILIVNFLQLLPFILSQQKSLL
jgi:hypothetical protein